MKLPIAVYKVVLGYKNKDVQTDYWSARKILAETVLDAIKQVKLGDGEYIAEVTIITRLDG